MDLSPVLGVRRLLVTGAELEELGLTNVCLPRAVVVVLAVPEEPLPELRVALGTKVEGEEARLEGRLEPRVEVGERGEPLGEVDERVEPRVENRVEGRVEPRVEVLVEPRVDPLEETRSDFSVLRLVDALEDEKQVQVKGVCDMLYLIHSLKTILKRKNWTVG